MPSHGWGGYRAPLHPRGQLLSINIRLTFTSGDGSAAGITIITVKFGGSARVFFIGNWPKGLSWASSCKFKGVQRGGSDGFFSAW